MKTDDFAFISTLLKDRSGLVIDQDKGYLLESRLTPVAHRSGFKDLDELVTKLRLGTDKRLIHEVVDSMTTNESFFFRDVKPFEIFRDTVLPHMLEVRAKQKSLRVWCAAASSGQEPYSLAMVLAEEAHRLAGWHTEILATDISTKMLAKAKEGVYSQFEVQRGLPIQSLLKHFDKEGESWRIRPELRAKIDFREFNLLNSPRLLGRFDVVFCRNVLIYFDRPTKGDVLGGMADVLAADGFLFLGGAETVLGISDRFKTMNGCRGVYTPTEPKAKAAPTTPTMKWSQECLSTAT